MDEPGLFHSGNDHRHVAAPDKYIHIPGVADDRVIHSRNPCGDRVSADHGVFDPFRIQGTRGSSQPVFNFLDSLAHALP